LLDHPLSLRSRPGHGTMFAIEVPISPALGLPPAPSVEPMLALPRRRLLVVDNDPAVLKAMQALLAGWQADILAAQTLQQARQLFETHGADVLLLDYHLDDQVSGLELRESLGPTALGIPCVIITADHGKAVADAVLSAGCHLLHKPLKPLALRSLLAQLIAREAGSGESARPD
jgi:CheY-like chemotaxis protein